jgi:crossover junction endodeoxyribonuclease RuvC
MVKVIGIDPGLADTGIGIVRGQGVKIAGFSFGSIHTSSRSLLPERLECIYSRLQDLVRGEAPDLIVVEDVFSLERYPKSGITLGKVTGVILLAACRAGVTVSEIPVREAKQVLTGNGNADKQQLEKAVRHFLGVQVPIRPYHASDALGLAIIGLFRHADRFQS